LGCLAHRCQDTFHHQRLGQAGLGNIQMSSENVAQANSPRNAHLGLMNSPAHRQAILSDKPTRYGIGITIQNKYGRDSFIVNELFLTDELKTSPQSCVSYLEERLSKVGPKLKLRGSFKEAGAAFASELLQNGHLSKRSRDRWARLLYNKGYKRGYRTMSWTNLKHPGQINFDELLAEIRTRKMRNYGIGCARRGKGQAARLTVVLVGN
jgi:hypothetical protein